MPISTRVAVFLGVAWLAACAPPIVHTELGAPTARATGQTLVLLPRTCLVEKSVPAFHFGRRPIPDDPRLTTGRLRAALDALLPDAPPVPDGRPIETCPSLPPDLVFDTGWLAEVRASDEALRLMRRTGAAQVAVIELHTVMACARRSEVERLAMPITGVPDKPPEWSPNDVCLEDEITLTAYLFREDGKAVWAVTRDVGLGEEAGWAVDRVLERIPAAMPRRAQPMALASAETLPAANDP